MSAFDPPPPWEAARSDPRDRFVADLVRESAVARRGFGLFGVPFDGAVLGRPGARGGPDAIRAALSRLKPWTVGRGEIRTPLRDFGNVRVANDDTASAHAAAEEAARLVLAEGLVPFALGGDHSLTYPLVRAHAGRRLGVVNVDAHLDLRDVTNGRVTSGTPFGRLLEHPDLLLGRNLVEVGVRDFATSPAYGEKAAKHGVRIVAAGEARRDPVAAARIAAGAAADGTEGVYVSIDVDVLDASEAPGVSAPTPGGIASADLYTFLATLVEEVGRRSRLVGVDVVEVAPALDANGATARAAASAVLTVVAGATIR